jgi:hypothetical protein
MSKIRSNWRDVLSWMEPKSLAGWSVKLIQKSDPTISVYAFVLDSSSNAIHVIIVTKLENILSISKYPQFYKSITLIKNDFEIIPIEQIY